MICTPSTPCSFFRNNGVSSSLSVVFVAFSTVAFTPSVTISRLASSDVLVVIVGGTSLHSNSSCVVFVGSTRLTQISSSDFCSPYGLVWVELDVTLISVWVWVELDATLVSVWQEIVELGVTVVSVWQDFVFNCSMVFVSSVWLFCSA